MLAGQAEIAATNIDSHPGESCMKVDKTFDVYDPCTFAEEVRALDAAGYDGMIVGESSFDPFVPLAIATQQTSRLDLLCGIALALPRSPTQVAYVANDLQTLTRGQF